MYINSHFKELKLGQSLLMEATYMHFIFHLIVLLTSSYLFINSKLQINEACRTSRQEIIIEVIWISKRESERNDNIQPETANSLALFTLCSNQDCSLCRKSLTKMLIYILATHPQGISELIVPKKINK